MENDEIATDKMVSKRSRSVRLVVLIAFGIICVTLIHWCVNALVPEPLKEEFELVDTLANGFGYILGIGFFGLLLPRFFVRVVPNTLFLTQDLLASFYGGDVDVVYGPGFHISFPWEGRSSTGVISLEESTVKFEFETTLPEGALWGEAAYWLRADPMRPIEFLRSVASVGEELENLVIAEIQGRMGDPDFRKNVVVSDTSKTLKAMNEYLKKVFVKGDHEIEKRNGVIITGVAAAKLSPSDELLRTLTAVTEARGVQAGVAVLLGLETAEDVQRALKEGEVTQADIQAARRTFQQISGNVEGVTRVEYDLSISGLTPEVAAAITAFMQTPAGIALATRGSVNNPDQKKGKS